MRKAYTSIELDLNGEHAFQLNFSDFGTRCETAGRRNVNWIIVKTVAADVQYASHQRGLLNILSFILYDYYGGSGGSLAFLPRKFSSDPSQAQLDQEGHRDLSTIHSLTAIPGHIT